MSNAMSNATRARTSSTVGKTRIPSFHGKENACPSANVAGKRVSFANVKKSACRTLAPLNRASNAGSQSYRTNRTLADTFAAKRTSFQIHCDERNTVKVCKESRTTVDSNASQASTRSRSIVGRGPIERPPPTNELPPSKIPRRTKSSSISTERNRMRGSTFQSTKSTLIGNENAVQKFHARISDETSRRLSNEKGQTKEKEAEEGPKKRSEVSAAVLLSTTCIKPAAIQEINDAVSKVREDDRVKAPSRSNDREPFPSELIYHLEYEEDLQEIEQLREEQSVRLSTNFLRRNINAEQRRLMVTFMIHLGTHCRYLSFVVYEAVKLFDLALDRIPMDTAFVQLAALSSLWIALKKEENFHRIPTATKMVSFAKELYAGREDLLVECERKILVALNFNLTFADPFSLFNHYLINCKRCIDLSEETTTFLYRCGGYLIDLTLLDEQFCSKSASLIAVTAAELAFGLAIDVQEADARPRWLFWRGLIFANLPRLSGRFQDMEIDQSRVTMLRRVLLSGKNHYGFEAVYKKYSRSRYGRISERLLEQAGKLSASESLIDP